MFALIYFAIVIFGFVFDWPRGSKLFDVFVVGFISLLIATSTKQADYIMYFVKYQTATIELGFLSEPLWSLLMITFRSLGFDYASFIFILLIIFLTILVFSFRMLNMSNPYCWSLILLYPGLLGFTQIRQFFAIVIQMLAFCILVKGKRGCIIKYLLLVLCAGLIHSTAYLMLLIPFIKSLRNHKYFLGILVISIIVSTFPSNWMLELSKDIFKDDVSQTYLAGYGGVASDASRVFTICEVLGSLFLLIFINKYSLVKNDYFNRAFSLLVPINMLFVALIPILMINTDFLRILRYILFNNLVIFSCVVISKHNNLNNHSLLKLNETNVGIIYIFRILTFIYYFLLFYGLIWMQAYRSVIAPLLRL